MLALLGILTNYATGGADAPLPLDLRHKIAVPGLGVLTVAFIVLTAVSARLGNPPRAPEREWDPGRTPYPGLEAFAEDGAAVIFGRDEPLSTLLRQLYQRDGERFVVVTKDPAAPVVGVLVEGEHLLAPPVIPQAGLLMMGWPGRRVFCIGRSCRCSGAVGPGPGQAGWLL
ncbi:hypothetical protein AB0C21_08230 [Spirillospora sp. NPDC049024]